MCSGRDGPLEQRARAVEIAIAGGELAGDRRGKGAHPVFVQRLLRLQLVGGGDPLRGSLGVTGGQGHRRQRSR